MSCLYSSPELKAFNLPSPAIVPNRTCTRLSPHRGKMPLETVPEPSTIAFSKDAFPTRRRHASEPFI